MKPPFLSENETERENGLGSPMVSSTVPTGRIALLIEDPAMRRLVEGASAQLELSPSMLHKSLLETGSLGEFELIIADKPVAERLAATLGSRNRRGDGVNPAIIAISTGDATRCLLPEEVQLGIDGVIHLPQSPALVAAQLSVILYAHRTFANRYHSALEELHLNRRIFRSVTSGISVSSATLPDMPLVYVNPAFEVMTGYCIEEIEGKNCRFLQGENREQPGLTLVREALREQHEVIAILRNYRKDGTPFWNELALSPIRNREGLLTHFVGIQKDVTARIELEAALRQSEKLAAVGRLASSIAHEINNPLESVMNLLYLAQTSDDIADIKSYLTAADKEVRRVSLITHQSLRFYKQSSRPQEVYCREMLEPLLELYQSRLENAHIAHEWRDRCEGPIVCLESEIQQVLNNLIRNSLDARHSTGGRLIIRTREAKDQRSGVPGVMITVADTGTGISPELMPQLFKAFVSTKGIGGTGLGLWISQEIVSRHHGRMWVRSSQQAGRSGTVFELFLPSQPIAS